MSRTKAAQVPARVMLTIGEAAERTGTSYNTIRRRIASGDLVAYRFGPRLLRVDAADVDALLRHLPTAGASRPPAA